MEDRVIGSSDHRVIGSSEIAGIGMSGDSRELAEAAWVEEAVSGSFDYAVPHPTSTGGAQDYKVEESWRTQRQSRGKGSLASLGTKLVR